MTDYTNNDISNLESVPKEDLKTAEIIHRLFEQINGYTQNELENCKDKLTIDDVANIMTSVSFSFLGTNTLRVMHLKVNDKEQLEKFIKINKEIFENMIKDLKEKFIEQKRKEFGG